jgi:hypothetical protein
MYPLFETKLFFARANKILLALSARNRLTIEKAHRESDGLFHY